ncbi:MAG: hypothetical protein AB7P99_07055 [Vicinamibacterales bacterium]
MAGRSFADRVGLLEKRVDSLETLPAQVDALTFKVDAIGTQFQRHQEQNASEHSAIRDDIARMHEVAMTRLLDLDDRMGQGFETVIQRMDGMEQRSEARFERVDQRFEKIAERFDTIDERFERIDRRFDRMEQRFEQFERRAERFEQRFDRIEALLTPRKRRRTLKKKR